MFMFGKFITRERKTDMSKNIGLLWNLILVGFWFLRKLFITRMESSLITGLKTWNFGQKAIVTVAAMPT